MYGIDPENTLLQPFRTRGNVQEEIAVKQVHDGNTFVIIGIIDGLELNASGSIYLNQAAIDEFYFRKTSRLCIQGATCVDCQVAV